jgi:hypothetical protein
MLEAWRWSAPPAAAKRRTTAAARRRPRSSLGLPPLHAGAHGRHPMHAPVDAAACLHPRLPLLTGEGRG